MCVWQTVAQQAQDRHTMSKGHAGDHQATGQGIQTSSWEPWTGILIVFHHNPAWSKAAELNYSHPYSMSSPESTDPSILSYHNLQGLHTGPPTVQDTEILALITAAYIHLSWLTSTLVSLGTRV